MLKIIVSILTLVLLSLSLKAETIKYPNTYGLGTSSIGYAVLQLALSKSDTDYKVELDPREITGARTIFMLRDKQIDVASGGFLPPPDETITIVYKPVDMGLLGWRIFVTRKELLDKINSVKNAGDLKNYSFGQGSQWNDTYILKSVGLEVITVNKLSNLFGMLQASRFDLLPLGATEVYDYFERFGAQYPDLTIENTVTLVYPFARFFYIRKDSKELKKAIELGMEKALADGSLLSLLKSHPVTQDAFSRAKLNNRIKITIPTPNITEEFKAIPDKWWFTP